MKKVIVSQVDSNAFKDAYVSDFTAGVALRETYKMPISSYNYYKNYTNYRSYNSYSGYSYSRASYFTTTWVPPITNWQTTTTPSTNTGLQNKNKKSRWSNIF